MVVCGQGVIHKELCMKVAQVSSVQSFDQSGFSRDPVPIFSMGCSDRDSTSDFRRQHPVRWMGVLSGSHLALDCR